MKHAPREGTTWKIPYGVANVCAFVSKRLFHLDVIVNFSNKRGNEYSFVFVTRVEKIEISY